MCHTRGSIRIIKKRCLMIRQSMYNLFWYTKRLLKIKLCSKSFVTFSNFQQTCSLSFNAYFLIFICHYGESWRKERYCHLSSNDHEIPDSVNKPIETFKCKQLHCIFKNTPCYYLQSELNANLLHIRRKEIYKSDTTNLHKFLLSTYPDSPDLIRILV